jgi:hypothetical protein
MTDDTSAGGPAPRLSAVEWLRYAEGLALARERLAVLARGTLDALAAARPLDVAAELVELIEELDGLNRAALRLADDASKPGPKPRPKKLPSHVNALMALLPPATWPKKRGGRPRKARIASDAELLRCVELGRGELGLQSDVEAIRSFVAYRWTVLGGNRNRGSRAAEVKALQWRLSKLRRQSRLETGRSSHSE